MNPVEKVNHRLRHPDIDYEFRPSSYWDPANDVLQTVLRNVKGTRRREMITDFFHRGRPDELVSELTADELSNDARDILGKIHPTLNDHPGRQPGRSKALPAAQASGENRATSGIASRVRPDDGRTAGPIGSDPNDQHRSQ
ncbi:MAG TPA: hypothetical protein VE641_13295 [Chthoniobacterales bacterium]|nr:hypothetical protein [Chthoniobacterales bacterium]